jgi:hypothetical protein
MSDIWSSPVLKPLPETQSGQKTTTSTPNIISGRCPRTEERHRRLCYNDRCYQKRIDSLDNLSEPSSVISEDVCHEEQATGALAKGAQRTAQMSRLLAASIYEEQPPEVDTGVEFTASFRAQEAGRAYRLGFLVLL